MKGAPFIWWVWDEKHRSPTSDGIGQLPVIPVRYSCRKIGAPSAIGSRPAAGTGGRGSAKRPRSSRSFWTPRTSSCGSSRRRSSSRRTFFFCSCTRTTRGEKLPIVSVRSLLKLRRSRCLYENTTRQVVLRNCFLPNPVGLCEQRFDEFCVAKAGSVSLSGYQTITISRICT